MPRRSWSSATTTSWPRTSSASTSDWKAARYSLPCRKNSARSRTPDPPSDVTRLASVAVDDTNRTSRSLTTQQQAASLQVATPHRRTIRVVSGELTVIADGLSKQYPGKPGKLFPPVVSIFHRKYFTRSSRDEERKDAPPILMGMAEDPDDLDDLDDDDEDEEDEEEAEEEREGALEPVADEWIWALKDVSFEVHAGQALGLLGDQRAGKTTLLRIIGGRAF